MKILLVNNLYPPHSRGGAETSVVNEAAQLVAAGHEVSVLTTAPFQGLRSLTASEWKEDGIRVFRFFPLNLFWYRNDHKHNALVRALWYVGNMWGWHPVSVFKKVVKAVNPDVVHLHNVNGISYRLPRVCDRLKLKTVFTVHAVHYAVPSGVIIRGRAPRAAFKPFAALMRRALTSRAVVTAPSQWLLDFYLARGFFKGQKTIVVANPLVSASPVPKNAANGQQPIIRFLYVGQMEQYKGVNVLLAAARIIPASFNFEISLIGDGSLEPELRKLRDQRIRFRGRLGPEDVARAYAAADALIMPSLCEENSPMVIAEALSYGLPVIATVAGGIPEMVEHNVNGMLTSPGNAEELALQMRRVMECPEILPPMREAAVEAAKRYDPHAVAEEYMRLFSN
jgi:glycosyltransferase involved in cell wall biosynthesis